MRILIVDDEVKIRTVLKEYLIHAGYEICEACDGLEAIQAVNTMPIDLIIMDVMMPNLDGVSAIKEIKKEHDIPIIVLSARTEEYDRLYGFDAGADDYVTKPFSLKEMVARVNVILKRKQKITTKIDGILIDFEGRNVYVDDVRIELTQKEFQLLTYLIKNKGVAISRNKLLLDVWGYEGCKDDRTIDTHIKMLRNRLGQYKNYIVTLRGYGYKFDC